MAQLAAKQAVKSFPQAPILPSFVGFVNSKWANNEAKCGHWHTFLYSVPRRPFEVAARGARVDGFGTGRVWKRHAKNGARIAADAVWWVLWKR